MYTITTPTDRGYYFERLLERIVDAGIGLIEFLLFLRLLLELLAANASTGFVAWLYAVTSTLMGPFNGAFPSIHLGSSSFIDLSIIFAMVIYAIAGWLIIRILSLLSYSLP